MIFIENEKLLGKNLNTYISCNIYLSYYFLFYSLPLFKLTMYLILIFSDEIAFKFYYIYHNWSLIIKKTNIVIFFIAIRVVTAYQTGIHVLILYSKNLIFLLDI